MTISNSVTSTFPPNSFDQTSVDPAAKGTAPVIRIPTNNGKFIKNLNPNFSFIIIGIIINIAVSKSAEKLDLVKDYLIISIVISLIFIAITLLVLSLFSKGLGLKNEEKESIYMPSFFKNVSLAIIIVSFFEPEVVFFPVIYYIVEQIIPPIYYEIKKYNSEIFKLI